MTLKQGKNNKTYQVLSINIELLLERRLEALGLTEGAKITILNNNKKGALTARFPAKNSDTPLYLAKINGKQVYELVGNYLADFDSDFYVTNKYELPIASGMKIIVKDKE